MLLLHFSGAACAPLAGAQAAPTSKGQQPGIPVVLDRVIAVVNNRVILESDLDRELHLSALEPAEAGGAIADRRSALQRLISRTLIQQQIRQEDSQSAAPSPELIQARLEELRKELPACMRFHCAGDEGWAAFLAANSLTPAQVDGYLRSRLEILAFIENRFRQGIRIPRDDVEAYYNQVLVPQYPPGQPAPPLDSVADRIEEILLQQQVNALFDAWLDNLRKQGNIEIVDPALEPAPSPAAAQPSHGGGN